MFDPIWTKNVAVKSEGNVDLTVYSRLACNYHFSLVFFWEGDLCFLFIQELKNVLKNLLCFLWMLLGFGAVTPI